MKKTKKRGSYITKQERDAEWGKPLFSAVVQGKVKEIFRSLCFTFINMKVIMVGIFGIMLSIYEIILACRSNIDQWIDWLVLFLAIFFLILVCAKTIYPLLVVLFYCHVLYKLRLKLEIVFYVDCLGVYVGEHEVWNFHYEDLNEVRVKPKEIWFIFKKRIQVLLPKKSIPLDQQKYILDYLREKRPEVKFLIKHR
ncbi:hypothetical protein [Cuneatibacter caecimuris]|uniref:YcxB-like protein n=1 Tax=Cuneatibacter caecimuris TaxID=1796618 RepID=A0A4Q7PPZ8_9FIRM|nr:hypothetical protein [Cuneatibacter caecimuris]RZT02963.1 hypothetical protein EV209_1096 [Cuneatibacter caecimuris]